MNLIENGISKVLKVKRVNTKYSMYFEVTFIDWYGGSPRTKKFINIENLQNKAWNE